MSSIEYLKQFVSDKLAAVAEEIFAVFHNTIVEYEEELDRHRKLLEMSWKPEVKLRRIDLPRLCVFNEELAVDQQSSLDQDRTLRVDQEELELPVIKEQQEELSILQFRLKEEPEDLQLFSADGDNSSRTDTVVDWNPELSDSELQQFSFPPAVSQSQELTGYECENSRSRRPKRKNTNSNFQNKQFDNDENVNVPKPSTSLTDNRRRNKFKIDSKFQKNRTSHGEKTRKLSSRGTVLQHKTIHTANKPYNCQECGKSFSQSFYLEKHKKTHTYAERPHVCTTCGKRFLNKGHLKEHEQIHIGVKVHVCKVCNKRFLLKKNMTKHMKIHTHERPHVCETCGRSFTEKGNLKKHMILHKSEKRFRCKECGNGFPSSFALTYHVASAHYDF